MHRAFLQREPEVGVIDILQNICMPDLHTFRPARRATGVDKRQNGVRIVNWIRDRVALNVQRIMIKHSCHETCAGGIGSDEWRIKPRGCALAQMPSISLTESR